MSEQLDTRETAFARVPEEQRFQLRLVPAPGRLLFARTVGKTLAAFDDMFAGIHKGGEVVCLIGAGFDADGAFVADIAVLPVEATPQPNADEGDGI